MLDTSIGDMGQGLITDNIFTLILPLSTALEPKFIIISFTRSLVVILRLKFNLIKWLWKIIFNFVNNYILIFKNRWKIPFNRQAGNSANTFYKFHKVNKFEIFLFNEIERFLRQNFQYLKYCEKQKSCNWLWKIDFLQFSRKLKKIS